MDLRPKTQEQMEMAEFAKQETKNNALDMIKKENTRRKQAKDTEIQNLKAQIKDLQDRFAAMADKFREPVQDLDGVPTIKWKRFAEKMASGRKQMHGGKPREILDRYLQIGKMPGFLPVDKKRAVLITELPFESLD